jgi:hypothetical protein
MKRPTLKLSLAGLTLLAIIAGGCAGREREAYFSQQNMTITPRAGDQQLVAFPDLDQEPVQRTAQR